MSTFNRRGASSFSVKPRWAKTASGWVASSRPVYTSIATLLAASGPVALQAGTYSGDFDVTTSVDVDARGCTFTGKIRFTPGSENSVWRGGSFTYANINPNIHASNVTMDQIEVTNSNAEIGLIIGPWFGDMGTNPQNVVIKRSYLHDIGILPPTNQCHGIYNGGDYTIVEDCWIEDCADRGVQLYNGYDHPAHPTNCIVRRNVITNNGMGVVINGKDHLVEDNYIGNSVQWHVGRNGLSGASTARDNFWFGTNGSGTVDTSSDGGFSISSSGNTSGTPPTFATWSTNYFTA